MSQFGRILIVGSAGQVGVELQRSFAGTGELFCRDRAEVDIAGPKQVRELVRSIAPDLILNAAAYTAVDRAENERDLAFAINAQAPSILAEEACKRDIPFVHYSTDYIFDGSKTRPWLECDTPNPLNVYGSSKLDGELGVAKAGGKYLIFRTSWVYGPHGNNFLLTMLRLGRERERLNIVDDQIGAPTTSIELADATRKVLDGIQAGTYGTTDRWAGLYHMTCGGSTSWCGFAKEIFAQTADRQKAPEVSPISSDQYPTPAKRPQYSVLSNEKLGATLGVQLAHWHDALKSTLAKLQ